jgi:hypothetical protein
MGAQTRATGLVAMSRAARRDLTAFRREAVHIETFLVEPSDERLKGEPLLQRTIEFWVAGVSLRRPRCFACRTLFTRDGQQPGAFLMCAAAVAPTSATISALCVRCWTERPMPYIVREAERVLKPILPNGLGDTGRNP